MIGKKCSLYLVPRLGSAEELAKDMLGVGGESPLGTLKRSLPQGRRIGQTRPHIPQCEHYSELRYY